MRKDPKDENAKKMWRILVRFPETDSEPQVSMVLEIFTLVRVELGRKPKSNKLEGKLQRPVEQLSLL